MVELALLHLLEARSVQATRRVRNELAGGDGHLGTISGSGFFFAYNAKKKPLFDFCFVIARGHKKKATDLASVPVENARD